MAGNRLTNTWDASWTDAKTGKQMLDRGTEIRTMHGNQVAVWEKGGGAPATPVLRR